jgi:hypothetical protein
MTAVELLLAGVFASIVTLAAVSVYLTSMETWEQSGAELAIQRNSDLIVEWIASDIRRGSHVSIGSGGGSLSILRATDSGDSLVASYELVGDELKNNSGITLLDNVQAVSFDSPDNVKVTVSIELEDDLGTTSTTTDDARVHIRTTAVCRFQ